MLKDDLHSPALDNCFNFLQTAREEDSLLADGLVGISQGYIQQSPQRLRWPFHPCRHPAYQRDAGGCLCRTRLRCSRLGYPVLCSMGMFLEPTLAL